jgi:1D-myo-inositol-triphosphate 3-kinase
MIDFAKTLPLPDSVTVTHRKPWQQGNHEEGWLTGMDNLIKVPSFFRLSVLARWSKSQRDVYR